MSASFDCINVYPERNVILNMFSDECYKRLFFTVGRPINVERCEKPTLDQIHAVQKLYIEELYRWVFPLPMRK